MLSPRVRAAAPEHRAAATSPGGQATVREQPMQARDAALQRASIAGCGFGKDGMEIGESETGFWKMAAGMRGDLVP
jgi:hypothetical protein